MFCGIAEELRRSSPNEFHPKREPVRIIHHEVEEVVDIDQPHINEPAVKFIRLSGWERPIPDRWSSAMSASVPLSVPGFPSPGRKNPS